MNLLIIGDPKGTHSMIALKKYSPENIWVWENDPRHIYTINQINDRINVINDIQKILKFIDKGMRFNVIVGNPPYSDRSGNTSKSKDLDDKFTLAAIQIADKVKLIIRSKHFTNSKSSFRQELFASGHLVSIVRLPDDTFPVIQNTETCIITWDINHTGPTSITYKDGTVVNRLLTKDTVIKLDNPNFVESVDNNLSNRWIRGKLNRNKIIAGDIPMVEICGTGDTPVITYIAKGLEQTAANTYGVVINVAAEWGSLGKVLIKPYEASISSSVMCLTTKTQEEAIQLQNYLLSDEVKKIVKYNMPSFHPTKDLFKKIPSPFNEVS